MIAMIVGSSTTQKRLLNKYLHEAGVDKIIESHSGEDAFPRLFIENIDFIITEWNLPNMTGLEFVQLVKKEDRHKRIPILMILDHASKTEVVAAKNSGALDIIIKPVTSYILKNKLNQILNVILRSAKKI